MARLISSPRYGLRLFAIAAGMVALLVATLVLCVGWGLGVSVIRGPLPAFGNMKPNTAVGVGALGLALLSSQSGGRVRMLSAAGAGIATVLGAVTLAEYAFDWDAAGLDRLLFSQQAGLGSAFPGRPALLSGVLLLLLGLGLWLPKASAWQFLRTACPLFALIITWTVLNGYLFAHGDPPGTVPLGSVAVHTAGELFLIAMGALALQSDTWPVRTIVGNSVGGTVCRWLLPAAMLAPPFLGWLLTDPAILSVPRAALSWALYSVSSSVGTVGLVLILAHRIDLVDAERTAATMLSRHDPLTGLANRRAFDVFLIEAFNLARRHQRALTLLSIDIDHFKSYNDSFGHPAGDEVLKGVATAFNSLARETDLVARIGGEEFAVVLPETSAEGGRVLAERIRAKVAGLNLRTPVTVSIGLATLSGQTASPAALLKESDGALYAAKRGGRNRIAVGSLLSRVG